VRAASDTSTEKGEAGGWRSRERSQRSMHSRGVSQGQPQHPNQPFQSASPSSHLPSIKQSLHRPPRQEVLPITPPIRTILPHPAFSSPSARHTLGQLSQQVVVAAVAKWRTKNHPIVKKKIHPLIQLKATAPEVAKKKNPTHHLQPTTGNPPLATHHPPAHCNPHTPGRPELGWPPKTSRREQRRARGGEHVALRCHGGALRTPLPPTQSSQFPTAAAAAWFPTCLDQPSPSRTSERAMFRVPTLLSWTSLLSAATGHDWTGPG